MCLNNPPYLSTTQKGVTCEQKKGENFKQRNMSYSFEYGGATENNITKLEIGREALKTNEPVVVLIPNGTLILVLPAKVRQAVLHPDLWLL